MIYCVEDERNIRELLVYTLHSTGFEAKGLENGTQLFEELGNLIPDLILLDIMLPGDDGYTILEKIRQMPEVRDVPVIMVTAKGAEFDKVKGLDLGADDYIGKPFNPLEAVARINSNIRRFYSLGANDSKAAKKILKVKDLTLDLDSCILRRGEEVIELSSTEYRLMELFMSNPGKIYTKQQIYEYGWQEEYFIADNNIMVCISKLRAKLSEDGNRYIRTVRGLGYRFEEE